MKNKRKIITSILVLVIIAVGLMGYRYYKELNKAKFGIDKKIKNAEEYIKLNDYDNAIKTLNSIYDDYSVDRIGLRSLDSEVKSKISKYKYQKENDISRGAFIDAIMKKDVDRVEKLLEKGASVNCKETNTPLMFAAEAGSLEIVNILISKGARLNDKDEKGNTPLIIACKNKKEAVARVLLDKGADPLITNKEGLRANDYGGITITDVYNAVRKANGLYEPKVGMPAEEVKNSTWGKPHRVNTTTTKYGVREQWVYSGSKYIYLENGVVTTIQE